jgi:hypothetical protein
MSAVMWLDEAEAARLKLSEHHAFDYSGSAKEIERRKFLHPFER